MPPSVGYEDFMSRATRECAFQCITVRGNRSRDFDGIPALDRFNEDLGGLGLRECNVIAFDVEMVYP